MSETSPPITSGVLKHRHFIMYDALAKRPPYEAHKVFCRAINDKYYSYPYYDYWYYRFYHGKMDVNHDKNSDPKQPTICELPNEMLGEVMKYLDFQNRARVRKVCKKFCASIDQMKTTWSHVNIAIDNEKIELKMDPFVMEYLKRSPEKFTIRLGSNPRKVFKGEWLEYAFADLALYLRAGKVEIENLHVTLRGAPALSNRLIRLFTSSVQDSGAHFHVESVHLDVNNVAHATRLLVSLKPRILETIQIESPNRNGEIRKLMEMDQFKNAKNVNVLTFATVDSTLLGGFFHFREFMIRVAGLDARAVVQIRDNLSQQPNFQECGLQSADPLDLNAIAQSLGAAQANEPIRQRFTHFVPHGDGTTLRFHCQSKLIFINKQHGNLVRDSDESEDDDDMDEDD